MKPYRCPICDGRGNVPGGFYHATGNSWTSNRSVEVCRSCHGTGLIWWGDDVLHRSNIEDLTALKGIQNGGELF